jgi:hypothetical protein
MPTWSWKALLALSVSVMLVFFVAAAQASSGAGPLTGRWSGSIKRGPYGTGHQQHLLIVVDASERGGSWEVGATCRGRLRLKDVSNGYHHYIEELSLGATCLGGGIDCLRLVGTHVEDLFQPEPATSGYYASASFHRLAD